jgi:hypothetical protein
MAVIVMNCRDTFNRRDLCVRFPGGSFWLRQIKRLDDLIPIRSESEAKSKESSLALRVSMGFTAESHLNQHSASTLRAKLAVDSKYQTA